MPSTRISSHHLTHPPHSKHATFSNQTLTKLVNLKVHNLFPHWKVVKIRTSRWTWQINTGSLLTGSNKRLHKSITSFEYNNYILLFELTLSCERFVLLDHAFCLIWSFHTGVAAGKPLNVIYLERMLRCLTTVKLFRETVTITTPTSPPERRYALTPLSHFFVRNGDGVSMSPLLSTVMDPVMLAPLDHLHEVVADHTVSPFKRAHGVDAWEYGKRDARFDGSFNEAMFNHSMVCMREVLEDYRGFEGLGVLVDVGGGFGSTSALISEKYPSIKCINFDQPHVIAKCKEVKGALLSVVRGVFWP